MQKEKMAYHMFNQQLPPYLRVYAFIQSTGIHDWKTGSIKKTQNYTHTHNSILSGIWTQSLDLTPTVKVCEVNTKSKTRAEN
jgi:hypothetical protein